MRVIGSMYLPACLLAAVTASSFEPAKAIGGRSGKEANWPAKAGIKTPGIQIPMASLKADADIVAEASAESVFVSGDTAYLATKSQLLPLNLKTNKADTAIAGTKPCANLTSAFGSIWAPDCGESKISRLEAKTGKITASVAVPVLGVRQAVAASPDSIWVLSDEKTTLTRIDPEENKIVAEIRLPASCNSILFAENALWVTCPKENKVLRLDPTTNLVANRIEVPAEPLASTFGETSVWVYCKTDGKVVRIDPKTNKTGATVELKTPSVAGDLAFGEGFVWVSSPGYPVVRIDPGSDKVAQQFVGDGGGAIYFGGGSVWAFNLKANTLSRFDPKRIKATLAE